MTIGQPVKIVTGAFAGMSGVIEQYHQDAQTFDIRCGEDGTDPADDLLFRALWVSVPCDFVRFK